MPAPDTILELCEKFDEHRDSYHKGHYNETQLRVDFLDPLFTALGWDVYNTQGYAESYRDVIHEDQIKVGGGTKAPDYCFRIGGVRKFFVEAKKPSIDIKGDETPAYQVRRYAWSAKLPLSILTDFEEFAVYDSTVKPQKGDKASKARVKYFTYEDYADEWAFIEDTFSREAILKGRFDKFAESKKKKRGTAEVDDAFLSEIESWRDELARNIALRNPELSSRDLNHAVQATIDRIIFLRIAEDRGFESYGRLMSLLSGGDVYPRLTNMFKEADDRYNSGLFHFRKEKGRDEPDTFTLGLTIDDGKLKNILKRLYYPDSPYEFSVLPADILGQVYEQFLGKVITLTPSHRANVEEKPEVKKAGGVYYTPTYIVDYIVQHTVGELVKDKTWRQVRGWGKGQPLRVLDPACGSGSFLIGAYQFMLDWYLEQYTEEDAEKYATGSEPKIFLHKGKDGAYDYRLTINERKRILLDHIYGVDIDAQAVEVTKLSLLLKVLEGESDQTLHQNINLFHERALPDLADNIKCGNSLIGPDFYQNTQLNLTEEDHYRINAFDWQAEFPDVFEGDKPGFDAVIGNPPYVRFQTLRETDPDAAKFYRNNFDSAVTGNFDIYVLFAERGLDILHTDGLLGLILPHKFFTASYGKGLREIISTGRHLTHVVHFGDEQVFPAATTYTCLLFLSKSEREEIDIVRVRSLTPWRLHQSGSLSEPDASTVERGTLPADSLETDTWSFSVGERAGLVNRLRDTCDLFESIAHIFVGTQTSADDVFVLSDCVLHGDNLEGYSKALDERVQIERALTKPFLRGREIKRYIPPSSDNWLICPYHIQDETSELIDPKSFEQYPKTLEYLSCNRTQLEAREGGKFAHDEWYAFGYPKSMHLFDPAKVIVPDYGAYASFTIDTAGHFFKTGYGVIPRTDLPLGFLSGLLNSRLLFMVLQSIGTTLRGGYIRFWTKYLNQLPAPPDSDSNADLTTKISDLAKRMLDLHARLREVKTAHDRRVIERQIQTTDQEIDRLVYTLYGLTEAEIKVVEEATKK